MPPGRANIASLFRQHHDSVWRTLRALGVPPAQIDDAVQEVFLVAHRRRADFDARSTARAWLHGIARKVGPRIRDRAAKRQSLPLEGLEADHDPDVSLERRRAADRVAKFLVSLEPAQREVFVLSEIEGMSAVEIAKATGAGVNTVYSRLRLARKRFTKMGARGRAQEEGGQHGPTR